MTIQPCIPHVQSHTWGLAVGGTVATLDGLAFGPLSEALDDASRFCEVIPSKHFSWQPCVKKGKKRMCKVFDPPFRYVVHPATWLIRPEALGVIAQATGLRRLHATAGWSVCAPNAVLHPQMGPCVTMATDGVHVILWSKPFPDSAEWLMAHVTNVHGPVTSTPTALWEWCPGARDRSEAVARRAKPSPLALALAQLSKALSGCGTVAQPTL